MKKNFLLYHIIYIAFFSVSYGQELNLKIVGRDSLENRQIDSIGYKKNHIDYNSAKMEIDSTFSKLSEIGYLECKILSVEKANDSTILSSLSLGEKYKSLTVYFDGQYFDKNKLSFITTKITDSSFTIPISHTKQVLGFLNRTITENGFPFALAKLSDIRVDGNKLVYSTLEIDLNGSQRKIDKIIVRGYDKFPKSYIKHYLKIKEGSTFSIEKIKNKTRLLDNLRFASELRPPEVLFRSDSTTLYLYIEKRKSNAFDGFLGFGTNEETNKIEFDGYLDLQLHNTLNYGESLALNYKSDENKQRTFNVKVTLPYLLKSPLGTELELRIFKKDTLFTTVNQIANLFYQFNSRNRLSFGIDFIQSNSLSSNIASVQIEDYKTNLYSLGYSYSEINLSNSYLFPYKMSISSIAGLGNRTVDGDKQSQTKLFLDTYRIFELNNRNIVYLRVSGAGLLSDTYFENELLRFGGINSIRGFEENSLTATTYAVANSEYRYLLSPSMYVHTIVDFSYIENQITSQKEKLYGFGFGFGILTQAGLFKLIYANGKSENQNFKLSNSKVHLSLSAFF